MLNTETKYIFQAIKNRILTSKLHTHTFYEFICVISGSCTHFCEGISYEMNSSDFVLLCPGHKHCILSLSDSISFLCISISEDEFQKYKLLYGDILTANAAKPTKLNAPVSNILSVLASNLNTPTQNEIRAICSSFFASYCDAINASTAIPRRLQQMTEQMLNDPDLLQAGIKAMMNLINYSEVQLGRLTRKYYNASPHEYLKQLRLQKAWQYILQTDLALEEISSMCGYSCYGYFTNIFKKQYGFSPSMLRKTKH